MAAPEGVELMTDAELIAESRRFNDSLEPYERGKPLDAQFWEDVRQLSDLLGERLRRGHGDD